MEPINLTVSVFLQGMCAGSVLCLTLALILVGLSKAKEKRGP